MDGSRISTRPGKFEKLTSNADSAQSKDVWNENLEFSMSSADCLQNPNEPFRDF